LERPGHDSNEHVDKNSDCHDVENTVDNVADILCKIVPVFSERQNIGITPAKYGPENSPEGD
jgi:hypothetical protein